MHDPCTLGRGYVRLWSRCTLRHAESRADETCHRTVTALQRVRHAKRQQRDVHCREHWQSVMQPTAHNAWRSTIFVTTHTVRKDGELSCLCSTGCVWIAFALRTTNTTSKARDCDDRAPDYVRITVSVCVSPRAGRGTRQIDCATMDAYYAHADAESEWTWYMGVCGCSFDDHQDTFVRAYSAGTGREYRVMSVKTARFHNYTMHNEFHQRPPWTSTQAGKVHLYLVTRPWEHEHPCRAAVHQGRRKWDVEPLLCSRRYGTALTDSNNSSAASNVSGNGRSGPPQYVGLSCEQLYDAMLRKARERRNAHSLETATVAEHLLHDVMNSVGLQQMLRPPQGRKRSRSAAGSPTPRSSVSDNVFLTVQLNNTLVRNKALLQIDMCTLRRALLLHRSLNVWIVGSRGLENYRRVAWR